MAYEKRDRSFEEWVEEGDIPLPCEGPDRDIAIEGLRLAFNAGWEARKVADYRRMING